MKGGFVLLNGKFHQENEPILKGSELLNMNNGIRETFRSENNEILFAEENYLHLLNHLSELELPVPKDWDLSRLKKDVSRLLNKNHFFLAARITIYFYQQSEITNYLLHAEEIERGFYPLNDPGLLIDFYEESNKNDSPLSCYESSSRFLWILASRFMKRNAKQNLLISNTKEFICEGIGVSFGYIYENTIYFPSKNSGGYYPPLIEKIAGAAKNIGFEVKIINDVPKKDLMEAEEVFLIDNCLGIQKVLGLNSRRYYSSKTTNLANAFKESVRTSFQKPNSV